MISRRSFAALAGAGLFGLFARIRFKPSAPRGRRISQLRRVAWGEFDFYIRNDEQLTCTHKAERMESVPCGDGGYQAFEIYRGHSMVRLHARRRDDGHIGVSMLAIHAIRDESPQSVNLYEVCGPVWDDFASSLPNPADETAVLIEYPGTYAFDGKADRMGFMSFALDGPNLV